MRPETSGKINFTPTERGEFVFNISVVDEKMNLIVKQGKLVVK